MMTKHQFIFAVFLLSMLQSSKATDQDNDSSITLTLKPKECVVLKEGDKCYAKIMVKWEARESDSFCLYRTPDAVRLVCWSGVSEGLFTENLVMSESVNYYLALADSSEILIEKNVDLSWVYKKSSRPELIWRSF